MRKPLVVDSNVVFDVLAKREDVAHGMMDAMEASALVYLCPFVHFEVTRGFIHKPNAMRERVYHALSQKWHWDDITRADWNCGARLWAASRMNGRQGSDADLMIAAYAMNRGASVVTADVRDFEGLPVVIENWRSEE